MALHCCLHRSAIEVDNKWKSFAAVFTNWVNVHIIAEV